MASPQSRGLRAALGPAESDRGGHGHRAAVHWKEDHRQGKPLDGRSSAALSLAPARRILLGSAAVDTGPFRE